RSSGRRCWCWSCRSSSASSPGPLVAPRFDLSLRAPQLGGPVPLEERTQLCHALGRRGVVTPLALATDRHQLSVPEHLQVLRDRGLSEAEALDHLADGPLALPEPFEDRTPAWIRDRLDGVYPRRGGHGGIVSC